MIFKLRKHFSPLFLFFFAVLVALSLQGQQNISYQTEFGSAYDSALVFLAKNKWTIDEISSKKLCPALCFSIVFPEIVRYNTLVDAIQISALKMLYKQFGSDYADFSVGRFQMKPSFALQLEKDWMLMEKQPFVLSFDTSNSPFARHLRLERLENIKNQIDYLCMFVVVCQSSFVQEISKMPSEDARVRFLATAYNFGYKKSFVSIVEQMNKKNFHTEVFSHPFTVYYSYADIASDFHKTYSHVLKE